MKEVTPGVYMVEGMLGGNSYLLHSGDGAILVDCGLAADADRILSQVSQIGLTPPVHSIVLTHYHGDHAGGAANLAKQWGAQVMAHQEDTAYISRPASIPAFAGTKLFINWLGANVIFRYSACMVDRMLVDGDRVDALGGCIVIHTPGHTAGSLCLYQPERQILLCGDAIFNQNPVTRRGGMGIFARPIALDIRQAELSIRKLSSLPVKVLCFGHGKPIVEGAGDQIEQLLTKLKSLQ